MSVVTKKASDSLHLSVLTSRKDLVIQQVLDIVEDSDPGLLLRPTVDQLAPMHALYSSLRTTLWF